MNLHCLKSLRLLGMALLVAAPTIGCLGHVYEIPRPEVERLLSTPPQDRGQNLFAIQQFSIVPDPPPAPAWGRPEGEPPPGYAVSFHGYWVPTLYLGYGTPSCPPRAFHAASAVGNGGTVGNGSTHTADATPSHAPSGTEASVPKDGGAIMAAAVIAGLAVGVGLVASEGLRYDGTVAVHPHHPVHLMHGNEDHVVGLDELSAEALEPNVKALVVGDEGAGLWLRDRAPLNRQGFSFQFGGGNDTLALPGTLVQGLGWHFALGYFPTRWLGLLAETRLLSNNTGVDSYRNTRLGVEVQAYPLALWRLHLGAYGGVGESWYASGGATLATTDGRREFVSVGGLAELDLTTHLALTFRGGVDFLPAPGPATSALSSAWFVGLAVY